MCTQYDRILHVYLNAFCQSCVEHETKVKKTVHNEPKFSLEKRVWYS